MTELTYKRERKMTDTEMFQAFVQSLEMPQLFKLQPKLRPEQMPPIMQIAATLSQKKPVDPAIIRKVLESIDGPQLASFKPLLTDGQYAMLERALGVRP